MSTTNIPNSLNIRGLIGKEFLYDENLLISNYNPFVTTNISGTSGLYPDTTLTGKLYIFNKKEYKEPSKEEFKNIKSVGELAAASYRLIPDATFNSLSISILSKYNENSKERTFQLIKENSILDINPTLSNGLNINEFLYNPENNNLGTFAIFVIDYSTETGKLNKKAYTDLAAGEQFLMYLIPSELINVSESGMGSTKLISLTLSDASKQSISTNVFEVIPSTIPEESGLNYFYAESLLTIPGDTNYTRTNTFNSINIYFKVSSNNDFNFETNGFGLSEILKQSIFNNFKASLLNDVKFSTFDISVLSLDKLIFSLNNNEIFVSLTLSNTENNIILPETPTLNLKLKDELNYTEETVNEFLNVELLNFKGTYLLPLIYYTLRYNDSNGVDGFFELQQLAYNNLKGICFSTGDKDLDLPNRKVYLYGGAIGTSDSSNETITDTLLRSNIQNDGSLEGFTQIDTNSLKLFQAPTYTYINDPINGTGWVYVFCGLRGAINAGTTTTTNRAIKRAPILSDGTIGTWEDIYTFDNFYQQRVIGNPDDKRYFYIYSSLKRITSTHDYSFLNKIFTFRINEDGSITLIQTYASTKNHYGNSSIILKDPVSNKQYLYIFGTRNTDNDLSVYKYEITPENQDPNLSYNIIGNAIKVGNLDNTIVETHLIEDRENVYVVGGRSSTTAYKIGARRTVLKYPKGLLIKGSPTNLVNPEILPNISIPISVSVDQITTKYGSYVICPLTTTNETGTSYYWQSTNRVLGFKFNETNLELASSKLILNEFGNYPDDSVKNKMDVKTNFFPNKFGTRIKEELYTNLLVKQTQVLKFINNNNITFSIDGGVLNKITLVEMDKYLILPENTDIFLNWIKELCFNNALDRYNDFLIIGSILNSTSRNYDLIIPDIIFNILGMKELYPLNSIIFKEYLISNQPSIIIDPNNVITEKFIDIILYCFYNNIVKSKDNIVLNNKTQITYNMSGSILPDFSQFNFNKNSMNYKFIFTPQYHDKLDTKNIELRKNYNKTLPKESKYSYNQNNNYSTRIRKKIEELKEEYKTDFDYYVSPTGKNTNSGLHPEFPKDTLTDIPSGSKVLLLPGDYSTIISSSYSSRTDIYTRYTTTDYYIKLFNNMSGNLKIYGCGDKYPLKILNVYATYSNYESPPYHVRATDKFTFSSIKYGYPKNIEYFNLTIDFLCTSDSSGVSAKSFRFGEGYSSFYNCKFNTLKDYMKEGAKYYNCIFSETGTMYGNDVPTISIENTQEDLNFFSDPVNEIKWYKDSIDFLKNNYLHEPMYTLIPIGNEGEENVIQLDTTNNITTISNLDYKL